jgi:hypothetical protein
LIDLHVADMKEVGKATGRSKGATLAMLKRELGAAKMTLIDRDRVIQFGRKRAAEGAGPVTLSMDIGVIRLVLAYAAAVHGLAVSVEQIELPALRSSASAWSARATSAIAGRPMRSWRTSGRRPRVPAPRLPRSPRP